MLPNSLFHTRPSSTEVLLLRRGQARITADTLSTKLLSVFVQVQLLELCLRSHLNLKVGNWFFQLPLLATSPFHLPPSGFLVNQNTSTHMGQVNRRRAFLPPHSSVPPRAETSKSSLLTVSQPPESSSNSHCIHNCQPVRLSSPLVSLLSSSTTARLSPI